MELPSPYLNDVRRFDGLPRCGECSGEAMERTRSYWRRQGVFVTVKAESKLIINSAIVLGLPFPSLHSPLDVAIDVAIVVSMFLNDWSILVGLDWFLRAVGQRRGSCREAVSISRFNHLSVSSWVPFSFLWRPAAWIENSSQPSLGNAVLTEKLRERCKAPSIWEPARLVSKFISSRLI